MIKAKVSMRLKKGKELPTDIEVDVPKEYCNRGEWNKYIKEILLDALEDRIEIVYELC